jgi:hypothetical protein
MPGDMLESGTPPATSRLWHAGVTVCDLLTSLEFYASVVGLTAEYLQEERGAASGDLGPARGDVTLADKVTAAGEHGRSFCITGPDGVPVEFWQSVSAPRDRFNREIL